MKTQYSNAIVDHYSKVWSAPLETVPFNKGPIWQLPRDFAVLCCPPHGGRKMWTYATQCMSQSSDSVALELHMFTKNRAEDLTELLVVMAHYHRTAQQLGLHHTVNFGRPWLPNSVCEFGFMSLPYLDGPKLEWMESGSTRVRFLWVIPISGSEREFKKREGADALEAKFEQAQFDYADPERKTVV